MKYLILLLIMSCTFGGEVKFSPAVEKALMQFDIETLKAKVELDKKIVEFKKSLVVKLDREISVASQAGDLDLAVAIKNKREEFLPVVQVPRNSVIGKWSVEKPGWSSVVTINEDGSALSVGGDVGTWKLSGSILRVDWTSLAGWEEFRLDGTKGDSWTGKATTTATKIK